MSWWIIFILGFFIGGLVIFLIIKLNHNKVFRGNDTETSTYNYNFDSTPSLQNTLTKYLESINVNSSNTENSK